MSAVCKRQTSTLISRLESSFGLACFSGGLTGLCHTTAVVDASPSHFFTININGHSPRSTTDFNILMASRAASDAIIQSAACIRDEHAVRPGGASSLHLQGPHAEELSRWRHASGRPTIENSPCIVMSRGGNIPPSALCHDPDTPLSQAAFTPWLLVPTAATATADQTMQGARHPAYRVTSLAVPSVLGAASAARALGAARVSIEAGPSTTRGLYDGSSYTQDMTSVAADSQHCTGASSGHSCPVDWLFLSVFTPAAQYNMHPSAVGGCSLAKASLHKLFDRRGKTFSETTQDGQWHFAVFRNKHSSPD